MEVPLPKARAVSGEERLTVDHLTGLRNEYLFRLRFAEEFRLAREREANAALLVIKLDNILGLNALHGRRGGDEALRAVAYVLENYRSAAERTSHLAFRLGGPLFGYFMPACSAPEARRIGEELRRLVEQSELYLERLTVSIGVANLYEFFLEDGTAAELALRVEQTALYRLGIAERSGMNTICDTSDIGAAAAEARIPVLVVEPEPASLDLLLRALEAAEFSVEVCQDGENALSLIASAPPRVIICEAMTPRLNGFTIRERLRANALWNTIPFILVSHRKNDELIRKAVHVDIRHYFRKPLSITEVVGLVSNLTRRERPGAGLPLSGR